MRPGERYISTTLLFWVLFFSLSTAALLFHSSFPTLTGIDGYYHIRMASLLRQSGIIHDFTWARFSVFYGRFADKDFLFHLLLAPFTLAPTIMAAAKYAIIFLNILFIGVFLAVLRAGNSTPKGLLCSLIPFSCAYFIIHLFKLRPATLVNIYILLAVYCLTSKRWIACGLIAVAYTLSHLSFPLMLLFAVICECVRYIYKKEFCVRTIAAVCAGIMIGIIIHPNFPHNILIYYLNGFRVPWAVATGSLSVSFGGEFLPLTTKYALLANCGMVITLLFILWHSLSRGGAVQFRTLYVWSLLVFFLLLSLVSARFWYHTVLLTAVFASLYLADNTIKATAPLNNAGRSVLHIGATCFGILSLIITITILRPFYKDVRAVNEHYETAACWIRDHIPQGEMLFHSRWSDSPYFFCFDPDNTYLVLLDPVFMAYADLERYHIYREILAGLRPDAYKIIPGIFNAHYGYTRKHTGFYRTIQNNPHFAILWEDRIGAVFRICDPDPCG